MQPIPSLPKVYALNRVITQDVEISNAIDQQSHHLNAITTVLTESYGRGESNTSEKNTGTSMRHPATPKQQIPINILRDIQKIMDQVSSNFSRLNHAIEFHKPYRTEQQTIDLHSYLENHVNYHSTIYGVIENDLATAENAENSESAETPSTTTSDSPATSSEYSTCSEHESSLDSDSDYISESEVESESEI